MNSPDPPHVVHVIDELPPDGAERLLADVLRHRSGKFRFSVLCLIGGGELVREIRGMGVPVTILGRRRRFDPVLIWRTARWLRREHAAIVHTHLFTADTYGRLAARLAGVTGVFATVHSTNLWKKPVHRIVDWLLARISTRVIACTQEVGELMRRRDRLPPDRIEVIANGIDLGRFADVHAGNVRAEFSIPDNRTLIGVVGRLHPVKGHRDLIAALALLRDSGHDAACLFVGSGEMRPALEQEVARHGLAERVVFAGQRSDVPRLMASLDILAMPSLWEGLPMTLLEAMALGKAVVATRVGGIPDVIVDGESGLLVAPGDPKALASALKTLITDPRLREALGQRARTLLRQHYDVTCTARAYEALYSRALGLPAAEHEPISEHPQRG
jgi:glycosyltransferase involved in cell wall biosynthesis